MLGNFRIRMLAVLIIIFLAGFGIQGSTEGRKIVEPALRYILKDYGFNNRLSLFWENMKPGSHESVPAGSSALLQIPCEFSGVIKGYGWHYNDDYGKQEFLPGVFLEVKNNSAVKPILAGEVQEIGRNDDGRTILVKHNEELYSLYGGLNEVLAEERSRVDHNSILGKSGEWLYLEIRNDDGPLNPHNLINEQP